MVGLLYSAMLSLILILMIFSLPLGPYIVFHLDVGNGTSPDFPLLYLDGMLGGAGLDGSRGLELGDIFIVMWSAYVVLFAMALHGPKRNFLQFILPTITDGNMSRGGNYAVDIIRWFTIIVLLSATINLAQESVGIITEPPAIADDLLLFVNISSSPIVEELGFRLLLIGLPLYLAYSHRASLRHFLKSMWRPAINLQPYDRKWTISLIIGVGVLFGLAHVILGEPWTAGKFAQATVAGIILGWVYVKLGLLPTILIHWATNYFIYTYAYFVAHSAELPINDAFLHPLMGSLEILFLVAGSISALVLFLKWYRRQTVIADNTPVPGRDE